MLSITDKELKTDTESSPNARKEVRVTVTGLDEKGQMFRESAPVVELDGRECHFRSKFQPEMGSWVLVEFDLAKLGGKRTTVQGQVKSAQSDVLAAGMFRIWVELETAQELKVTAPALPVKAGAPLPPPTPVSAPTPAPIPAAKVEAIPALKETPPAPAPATVSRPKPEFAVEAQLSVEAKPSKVVTPAPVVRDLPLPKPQPEGPVFDREAVQAAITQEVKQQLAAIKGSLSEELERIAQRNVASGVEPIVRQVIEKQIGANFQTAIQTLNSDLTYQLAGHLANSQELRGSIEKIAKEALEGQIEQARKSPNNPLNSRLGATEAVQVLEKSTAEMEGRLSVARDIANASLERLQTMEREITESSGRLQKVVDQMNAAARSTIEKFDTHIAAQLSSWSAQFKNHVDAVSQEKAAEFNSGMEHQLSLNMQNANEVLEKLSAGIQLAQGTIRMQETQFSERSKAIAADLEKEIKTVLLRLAGVI